MHMPPPFNNSLAELFRKVQAGDADALAEFLRAGADPQAFLAFLKTIAETQVLQAVRKQRRHNTQSLPAEVADLIADHSPAVPEMQSLEERWQKTLERLPLVYRRVAELRRHEYSQLEIAAELGICERTVRTAIARLREAWLKTEE